MNSMQTFSKDPSSLLSTLVSLRSITPNSGGTLELLKAWLNGLGFEVCLPVFAEVGTQEVCNLYAKIGEGRPHLVFAGHVDVVPPGPVEAWFHHPFGGIIDNGILYGRGAADMKGGIACFLSAVQDFLFSSPWRGTISIMITCDEEGPAVNGTNKLLQWLSEHGEVFDMALLGEPTSREIVGDSIRIGRRGSLSGRIIVLGKQRHVASSNFTNNPITCIANLICSLSSASLDSGTDRFEPSRLEFLSIDTEYLACNVIPGRASSRFNVRFNDIWTSARLSSYLQKRLEVYMTKDITCCLEIDPISSEPFLLENQKVTSILSSAIQTTTGEAPTLSTDGGTSDARFIKDYCQVVECGLLDQTIHQPNECVAIQDLYLLSKIYREFLRRVFY